MPLIDLEQLFVVAVSIDLPRHAKDALDKPTLALDSSLEVAMMQLAETLREM